MKIKKSYLLAIAILLNCNIFAQNSNHYALSAITKAVNLYLQQKGVDHSEYMLVTIKLMKIDKNSGEFVLGNEIYRLAYSSLKPTHYIRVNNRILLIKVDSTCSSNPEKYGISKISEEIKKEALDILLGREDGICVTRQSPPIMIFKYQRNKLKDQLYKASFLAPEKYWF